MFLFLKQVNAQTNEYLILVGPKVNFNFSKTGHRFSGGIEVSAWTMGNLPLPVGADAGVDFERDRIRLYGEVQTGSFIGVSAGPVLEFTKEGHAVGFQSSIWSAFIIGTDFRYRRINNANYYSPGVFIKVPVMNNFSW